MVDQQAAEFNWPPLESNPEIYSEYMHAIGLPDQYAFAELFGLDEELLAMVPQPVDSVIACVSVLNKQEDRAKGDLAHKHDFYMKQTNVLDNACGIIACLHSILNNVGEDKIKLTEGSLLAQYNEKIAGKETPEAKSTELENFEEFKEAYVARSAQGQSNLVQEGESVKYHFLCFLVNPDGHLVEFDGMKAGPNLIKENCSDVLKDSVAEVKARLEAGGVHEHMSLMVLHHGQPMF